MKKITLIFVCIVLTFSLVGIGIGCKSETTKTETSVTAAAGETTREVKETTTKEEAKAEPVVLNLGLIGESKSDYDLYNDIVTDFMKENPEIQVKIDWLPWAEALAKFKTQFAAGTPPDVFWLWVNQFQYYMSAKSLLNLTPYIEKDNFKTDEFFPVSLSAYTGSDGNIYALPREISGMVVYYNKDLFDKAGLEYPSENWTWGDYLEISKKLTIKDANGKITQYGSAPLTTYTSFNSILWGYGAELLNADRTACTLDTPEAMAAIQYMADTINVDKITPTPAEGAQFENLFLSSKVAMFVSGRWSTQQLWAAENAPKWDIQHMPYGPKGRFTRSSAGSHAIAAVTKYPDQAWKLVKYLGSGPLMNKLAESGLIVPAYKPAAYSDGFLQPTKDPEHSQIFLDCLEYGKYEPVETPVFDEITNILNADLDAVWSGAKSVDDFIKEVVPKINDALKQQ